MLYATLTTQPPFQAESFGNQLVWLALAFGVLYLFLRGMTGAPGGGVFAWRPAGALVSALSDVLDAA